MRFFKTISPLKQKVGNTGESFSTGWLTGKKGFMASCLIV